ncbi:MAG TPA: hypothetical protein VD735_06145 [Candidatus Saccharimonadales bacterium]|nr:hypothetical protein [Candidatus Saccharimonadales bacterium]
MAFTPQVVYNLGIMTFPSPNNVPRPTDVVPWVPQPVEPVSPPSPYRAGPTEHPGHANADPREVAGSVLPPPPSAGNGEQPSYSDRLPVLATKAGAVVAQREWNTSAGDKNTSSSEQTGDQAPPADQQAGDQPHEPSYHGTSYGTYRPRPRAALPRGTEEKPPEQAPPEDAEQPEPEEQETTHGAHSGGYVPPDKPRRKPLELPSAEKPDPSKEPKEGVLNDAEVQAAEEAAKTKARQDAEAKAAARAKEMADAAAEKVAAELRAAEAARTAAKVQAAAEAAERQAAEQAAQQTAAEAAGAAATAANVERPAAETDDPTTADPQQQSAAEQAATAEAPPTPASASDSIEGEVLVDNGDGRWVNPEGAPAPAQGSEGQQDPIASMTEDELIEAITRSHQAAQQVQNENTAAAAAAAATTHVYPPRVRTDPAAATPMPSTAGQQAGDQPHAAGGYGPQPAGGRPAGGRARPGSGPGNRPGPAGPGPGYNRPRTAGAQPGPRPGSQTHRANRQAGLGGLGRPQGIDNVKVMRVHLDSQGKVIKPTRMSHSERTARTNFADRGGSVSLRNFGLALAVGGSAAAHGWRSMTAKVRRGADGNFEKVGKFTYAVKVQRGDKVTTVRVRSIARIFVPALAAMKATESTGADKI